MEQMTVSYITMKTIEENLGFYNEISFIWSLHLRSKDGAVGVFAQYVNWKIAKNKKTMNPRMLERTKLFHDWLINQ